MNAAVAQDSMEPGLAAALQGRLVEFVRMVRQHDFHVGVAEEIDAQRVALSCGLTDGQRLRWGLRALLCSDQDEWERFDELFDAYWLPSNIRSAYQAMPAAPVDREQSRQDGPPGRRQDAVAEADAEGSGDGADVAEGGTREGASVAEHMARTDFQLLADSGQMRAMERLVERLARKMRRRLIRRQRVQRQGRRIHLRGTMRQCLRFGGMPLQLAYRRRCRRQPRLILIVDVSRSMSLYSHVFLRFARGIVNAFRDAAAFAYHTRLVPITDALRQSDQARMRESLTLISQGWSGGTRIGECLGSFNDQYARLLNSRSLVVIVSDGLDTGEPERLVEELVRIKARCRKLIWLNPLLGRSGYEPRTQGMQAALPQLDLFAPAHNLQSLQALEPVLTGL
ncbi:MAG: VWA domain-containing protein [Sedimenticolaceae bacterium]